MPIGDKDGGPAIFGLFSGGLKTNRDAWCYSFSRDDLVANMLRLVATYERDRAAGRTSATATRDATLISWNRGLLSDLDRGRQRAFLPSAVRRAVYRPYTKEHVYFDRTLNDMVYRLESLHPGPTLPNTAIYFPNPGSMAPEFMALAVDELIDNGATGSSGANEFARWRYEKAGENEGMLDLGAGDETLGGYRRIDNITDGALRHFSKAYGTSITKDDIFHYVYALLHSPDYRERYRADLRKVLPRIPLVTDPWPFVQSGLALFEMHIGYESAERYPLDGLDLVPAGDPFEFFRVEKMTYVKVRRDGELVVDKTRIKYNPRIELGGIPDDAHRYMLGARSAIEWVIDRYQVKSDKASGIVNDPNTWSRAVSNPRYVLDLLARVVTVSVETMKIVAALPALEIRAS
jgi:predicted helicase